MGMCTEHTLVGTLSPFQPIGICIEPYGILGKLWIQSMCNLIEPINSIVSKVSLRPDEVQK